MSNEQERAALAAQQVPAKNWEGAEEWMPLAWELCAQENGEEACLELVWEGGPVPEPWGDRWLKYEDQAKEMIALVRKHVPALAPAAPQVPAVPQWLPIETAPKDGRTLLLGYLNSHGKWRTMRGQWFSQEEIDEYWEDPDCAEPGWFETCVEKDDPPNCWATDPTHWMPLPAAPGAAQPVPQAPLTDAQLLQCLRSITKADELRLARDVGPYEITEPTQDFRDLVQAVRAAGDGLRPNAKVSGLDGAAG